MDISSSQANFVAGQGDFRDQGDFLGQQNDFRAQGDSRDYDRGGFQGGGRGQGSNIQCQICLMWGHNASSCFHRNSVGGGPPLFGAFPLLAPCHVQCRCFRGQTALLASPY